MSRVVIAWITFLTIGVCFPFAAIISAYFIFEISLATLMFLACVMSFWVVWSVGVAERRATSNNEGVILLILGQASAVSVFLRICCAFAKWDGFLTESRC